MKRVLVGIPTKARPDYLAGLLGTLMFQTYRDWDLLVVRTDPDPSMDYTQPSRFYETLRAMGHAVTVIDLPTLAHSEATAVNRILLEAKREGYELVYKIDDDHVMPPDTLRLLVACHATAEDLCDRSEPVLVSGLTPWMDSVSELSVGPSRPHKAVPVPSHKISQVYLNAESEKAEMIVGHWDSYVCVAEPCVRPTGIASAANFMMRPDVRIQWSDNSLSSLFADAAWFVRLQQYLGYRFFFEMNTQVWHVNAKRGGTWKKGEDTKFGDEDKAQRSLLEFLLRSFKMTAPEY